MGSFFKGNQNLKIYGGEFNNVKGNLEITNNYGQHGREMPSMRSRTGMLNESQAENIQPSSRLSRRRLYWTSAPSSPTIQSSRKSLYCFPSRISTTDGGWWSSWSPYTGERCQYSTPTIQSSAISLHCSLPSPHFHNRWGLEVLLIHTCQRMVPIFNIWISKCDGTMNNVCSPRFLRPNPETAAETMAPRPLIPLHRATLIPWTLGWLIYP